MQRSGIRLGRLDGIVPDAAAPGAGNKTQYQCPDPTGQGADGRAMPAGPPSGRTRAHRALLWNAFDTSAHVSAGAPPGTGASPPPGRGSAISFRWRHCRRRRHGSGVGGRDDSATAHFIPMAARPPGEQVAQVIGPVPVTQLVHRGELIAGERIPSEQGRGRRLGGDVTHTGQQGVVSISVVRTVHTRRAGLRDGPGRLRLRDLEIVFDGSSHRCALLILTFTVSPPSFTLSSMMRTKGLSTVFPICIQYMAFGNLGSPFLPWRCRPRWSRSRNTRSRHASARA